MLKSFFCKLPFNCWYISNGPEPKKQNGIIKMEVKLKTRWKNLNGVVKQNFNVYCLL